MAGSNDTTQPKTTVANEKPYVLNIIEGTSSANERATKEWGKLNALVKLWIFGTISKPLLQRVLKKNVSAHDVWKSLKAVFHNNKTARAMQLDIELRTIELGSLSITEYCNKISRIVDLLANIDSPVNEKNLVTYAINGLPDNFGEWCKYVHSNPAGARNGNKNNRPSAAQWNNTTGRVMHGHRITISPTRPPKMSYAPEPGTITNPMQPTPTWTSPPPQYHPTITPFGSRGVLGPAPGQAHVVQPTAIGSSGPSSYTTGPPPGTWGPQVVYGPYVDQATTLLQAFNAMTVQDYCDSGWYMDTDATSHLASDTGKLTSISNKSTISSILVGNGNSIPVINSGYSMLRTLDRPLHLHNVLVTPNIIKNLISVHQFTCDNNCSIEFDPFGFSVKDLWTRHLLLRCNSTGDLYPIIPTTSSPTPLLSTNQSTWHQHLGHLGHEVFHFLVSNKMIDCNKTKPTTLCHAFQIGKHVRLPFLLSNSHVKNMFDIVHSDIWTSPIPSVGIVKSNPKFLFHVSAPSPIPRSHTYALRDPHWQHAMLDEYNALISNDGSLSRYKACLVANDHSQQQGIDCDETFSPVFKPATIRTVLSLAISRHWPIHQLDVKNAFLHGHLTETVYIHQPPGFIDPAHPNHGTSIAYLLIYVDDIILTASSTELLQQVSASLHSEFSMTDLGPLKYFLGISTQRTSSVLFLSQSTYASEVLERVGMLNCNASSTPVATESKFGPDGDPVSDPTLYRSLSGTLDHGLQLYTSLTSQLIAYSDADWAGFPTTRRSTSAKYHGVANDIAETAWVRNLLQELHVPLRTATLVYCDNVSAVYLSSNPVQHQRTKHIEIDIHFVRDLVATGQVRALHVPS
ncbi:ribonuclease H-like domain-containing protein [Tanacetum coccineum]